MTEKKADVSIPFTSAAIFLITGQLKQDIYTALAAFQNGARSLSLFTPRRALVLKWETEFQAVISFESVSPLRTGGPFVSEVFANC